MNNKIVFVGNCATTMLMRQIQFAERTNYTLIMARNGEEAIQKALQDPPDLILMDMTPSNLKTRREIREIKELRGIPVLLVRNSGQPQNSEINSTSSRCKDDPTRPRNWGALFEMVDTCLSGHGVHRHGGHQ